MRINIDHWNIVGLSIHHHGNIPLFILILFLSCALFLYVFISTYVKFLLASYLTHLRHRSAYNLGILNDIAYFSDSFTNSVSDISENLLQNYILSF